MNTTQLTRHIDHTLAQARSALTLAKEIQSTLASTGSPETPWRFTPTL